MKIRYVNYGIANRFPGKIELNVNLKKPEYKVLHDELLQHELSHTDNGYSWSDFNLDSRGFKNKKLYWKFILLHPMALIQFSPVYPSNKKIYYDISLLIVYAIAGSVMIGLGVAYIIAR